MFVFKSNESSFFSGPPKITKFHPRVIAALYSLVVLPCDYTATPKPTSVSWVLKSGTVLTSGTPLEQHIIFMPGGTRVLTKNITFYRNGSLVIEFVEHIDKGIYTCRVTSRKGSVSANTTLIVSGGKRGGKTALSSSMLDNLHHVCLWVCFLFVNKIMNLVIDCDMM